MHFSWPNVAFFVLFSFGHAALVVAALNRLLSLKISERVGHLCKTWHDAVVAIVPLAVGLAYGLAGPGLLFGGSWGDLPWVIGAYFHFCVFVGVFDPLLMLVRTNWPAPKALLRQASERIDLGKHLPQPRFGEGPHRRMALVPWNEALTVEFNEKELVLPTLPAACDGLSILHVSDSHFVGVIPRAWFERVFVEASRRPADLIVFTGDLLDDPRCAEWIPSTFGKLSAPLGCWYLLGNHDWMTGQAESVRAAMTGIGWTDIGSRTATITHAGESLLLAGSELPWMGSRPALPDHGTEMFRLLLSHSPDEIQWARQARFDLMLAGHNHGGQIRFPLFGPVYSPSRFGCKYASGLFQAGPTLLHVSRGLSGRHPLRINCVPEVTRLVLRADGTTRAAPHAHVH